MCWCTPYMPDELMPINGLVYMYDNSFICRGWLHLTNMALAFTQMSSFFNTTFKVNPQCIVTVNES